jgi:hypothetical protein
VALTAAGQQRKWGLGPRPFREFLADTPADKPFFYWYGSANPHRAYTPDAGLAAGKKATDIDRVPAFWPDTDVVRRDMLDYATEIEAFDREVGELMAALRESGRLENTLVVIRQSNDVIALITTDFSEEKAQRPRGGTRLFLDTKNVAQMATPHRGDGHPRARCRHTQAPGLVDQLISASGLRKYIGSRSHGFTHCSRSA